ncbi:protein Wnt-4-like isoform X2 [Dysidea avara]|uniref:protein Wnt-4-like isoform X2 n=1 Tax=Dysidea avara TaxID=196820 RepID=UPI003328CDC1
MLLFEVILYLLNLVIQESVDFALNALESNQSPLTDICRGDNGLNLNQKDECFRQPDAALAIAEGALDGLVQCSKQLEPRRWNCPYSSKELFKNGLERNTRETAYVQAITSAGMVYSIARACSREQIEQCSCDATDRPAPANNSFQWGGCGDNLAHGYNYASKFALYTLSGDASSLLRNHNSEAGRLAVTENYRKECYCHGISGSCSLQTCWIVTPTLNTVGEMLTEKYNEASQVTVSQKDNRPVLIPGNSQYTAPTGKDLVYIEGSPSHCERDEQYGSLGTVGRECDRKPNSIMNCDVMCCNRGFRRKIVTFTEDCNCKFIWCCHLKCEKCTHVEERYYCK